MSKRRRSISVDEHVDEEIRDDGGKFSPLVNKWAEEYYIEGKRPIMQEQQVEEMIAEIDQREAELDEMYQSMKTMFADQRETLRSALGEETADDAIDEVYDRVSNWNEIELSSVDGYENHGVPRDETNPVIQEQARQLGISPPELVAELERRDAENGYIDLDDQRDQEVTN